jgi:hypothetical protein
VKGAPPQALLSSSPAIVVNPTRRAKFTPILS